MNKEKIIKQENRGSADGESVEPIDLDKIDLDRISEEERKELTKEIENSIKDLKGKKKISDDEQKMLTSLESKLEKILLLAPIFPDDNLDEDNFPHSAEEEKTIEKENKKPKPKKTEKPEESKKPEGLKEPKEPKKPEEPKEIPEEGLGEKLEAGVEPKKLTEIEKTRQRLIDTENDLNKYKGLKGIFKGGGEKRANIEQEYETASKEYKEQRDKYIGEKISRMLEEQTELVIAKAENFDKEKGFGKKFYEAYKKLGQWNLGALLGKKFMSKLEKEEGDNKLKRFSKGTAKFLLKMISVRMGISIGLLGAGLVLGGGIGFTGALAARRVLAGFGTGFGSYDLMKMFGSRKEMKKGMRKEMSEEEIKKIEVSEITDRMSYFEHEAESSGNSEGLNSETYKALSKEFKSRIEGEIEGKKVKKKKEKIQELIKEADESLEKIKGKERKKEVRRKGIATSIGLFVSSGALGSIIGLIKGEEALANVVPTEVSADVDSVANVDSLENVAPAEVAGVDSVANVDSLSVQQEDLIKELTEKSNIATENLDYQGGNSLWNEVRNQLQERTAFKDLLTDNEAEKTTAINFFKNRIIDNPQEYGLTEGADPDILSSEQLKNIDWDKLLSLEDKEIDKAFPDLTEEAKQNIIENNRLLQEYVNKTGESLDTDTVDQILEDIKGVGSVDEYLDSSSPAVEEIIPTETEIPLSVLSPEPIVLSEMSVEDMTSEQQELYQLHQTFLEEIDTDEGAQEAAKDFLDEQSPEVYNQYSDVKETIQNIRTDNLSETLENRGFLNLRQPDTTELMTSVQKLAETHDFSETESKLFSNWLAGEDGILKKDDFEALMTENKIDPTKFSNQIEEFNNVLNSQEIPNTYAWQPRHIYTGEGAERTEQLVNIREVKGGYQIDSNGDGIPNDNTLYKEPDIKEMLSKEIVDKPAIEAEVLTQDNFISKLKDVHPEAKKSLIKDFKVDDNGIITREGYVGTYVLKESGDLIYSGGDGPSGAEIGLQILKADSNFSTDWQNYELTPEVISTPETLESIPTPETLESTPPPETLESIPTPETLESIPTPETLESTPPPETLESIPTPETLESTPPPETLESTPTPETLESTLEPEDLEKKIAQLAEEKGVIRPDGTSSENLSDSTSPEDLPKTGEVKLNGKKFDLSKEEDRLALAEVNKVRAFNSADQSLGKQMYEDELNKRIGELGHNPDHFEEADIEIKMSKDGWSEFSKATKQPEVDIGK